MEMDGKALVTIPLVIQLAKERLWIFQCGWPLKRSGRIPGGPCKITLNSWHSLQQVSGSYVHIPGASPPHLNTILHNIAYVDSSLSQWRNCESAAQCYLQVINFSPGMQIIWV